MPRVVNGALAVFLLACISPLLTRFGGLDWVQRSAVLLGVVPVLLVAALCTASAARPGSLGRAVRRRRARRTRRTGPA